MLGIIRFYFPSAFSHPPSVSAICIHRPYLHRYPRFILTPIFSPFSHEATNNTRLFFISKVSLGVISITQHFCQYGQKEISSNRSITKFQFSYHFENMITSVRPFYNDSKIHNYELDNMVVFCNVHNSN